MKIHTALRSAIFTILMLASPVLVDGSSGSGARPNIIVILADDMGYSDPGCYGGEIETPNLDRLAENGLRLTRFYNAARCAPSRAALLTGLYPHQAGVGNMTKNQGLPAYQGYLNRKSVTLAEVLKEGGYFTAMTGKSHVSGDEFETRGPWTRGFDRSLTSSSGGYYYGDRRGRGKSTPLWLDGRNLTSDSPELPDHWYTTDLFTDYGVRFIDEAVAREKPFFLYIAHTAPHWPLQAPDEEVAKYRGKFMAGWDLLREARYVRQVEMGIIDPSCGLSPIPGNIQRLDDIRPWAVLSEEEKDRADHIMSIYAACVDRIDQSVGRLTGALAQRKLLENTLILFLSDNGAEKAGGPSGQIEKMKIARNGAHGWTAFAGQAWATLQNTPFRFYKASNHEGGICTPFIAHWPNGIKNPGTIRHDRTHIIDLMPTFVEMSGAHYPETFGGHDILPMEGISIMPVFRDEYFQAPEERVLYWAHSVSSAMIDGDWKLVRFGKLNAWELYNIKSDRTELNNLAAKDPSRVASLEEKWKLWAERVGVVPYPRSDPEPPHHP